MGSRCLGFSSCGAWPCSPAAGGIFLTRDQTSIPCTGGGFSTTGPPGKPLDYFLTKCRRFNIVLGPDWKCILLPFPRECELCLFYFLIGMEKNVFQSSGCIPCACCCCCYVASVMSDPVRPRRRQPTRLPRPWDSPGKSTGVGCYCLLHHVLSGGGLTKSCPTLYDPMDWSLPGYPVHGISQARILEWVAISFSRGFSQPRDWTCISCLAGGFYITEPPGKPIPYI